MSVYEVSDKSIQGDVISLYGKRYIVLDTMEDSIHVVALHCCPPQRHRSDVESDTWMDFMNCPSVGQNDVVRCTPVFRITDIQYARLGSVSVKFFDRIRLGVGRERQRRRYEDTAPLESNLMAADHSTDRKSACRERG